MQQLLMKTKSIYIKNRIKMDPTKVHPLVTLQSLISANQVKSKRLKGGENKKWGQGGDKSSSTKKGLTAQCRKSLILMAPFAGLEPATI